MDDSADLLAELARLQICNVCEIWMIYHLGTIHALWWIRKKLFIHQLECFTTATIGRRTRGGWFLQVVFPPSSLIPSPKLNCNQSQLEREERKVGEKSGGKVAKLG